MSKQLSHSDFIDLNQQTVKAYYEISTEIKTWFGYRLCGIDGSRLRMPGEPEIVKAFDVNPGKENQTK